MRLMGSAIMKSFGFTGGRPFSRWQITKYIFLFFFSTPVVARANPERRCAESVRLLLNSFTGRGARTFKTPKVVNLKFSEPKLGTLEALKTPPKKGDPARRVHYVVTPENKLLFLDADNTNSSFFRSVGDDGIEDKRKFGDMVRDQTVMWIASYKNKNGEDIYFAIKEAGEIVWAEDTDNGILISKLDRVLFREKGEFKKNYIFTQHYGVDLSEDEMRLVNRQVLELDADENGIVRKSATHFNFTKAQAIGCAQIMGAKNKGLRYLMDKLVVDPAVMSLTLYLTDSQRAEASLEAMGLRDDMSASRNEEETEL